MRTSRPMQLVIALLSTIGVSTGVATSGAAEVQPPPESEAAPTRVAWERQQDLVVIQRLPYEHAGRWTLAPFLGVIGNDPFVVYLPIGLRLGHHLNESLQLQFSASWLDHLQVDRDLRSRVGDTEGTSVAVDLQDQQVARCQLDASWTVLAAKSRLPGGDLFYTRGHLIGGFGTVLARDLEGTTTPRPEALFGAGFEAHLGGSSSLRAEIRQMVFARADGGALLPTEISLGWVWYLGGPLEGVR